MIFKALRNIIFCTAVFIAAVSCCNTNQTEKVALNNAAKLVDTDAGDALELLQTIKTSRLNDYDYAYFSLLQIRARVDLDITVESDESSLAQIKTYFIAKGDAAKTAYCCFVTASIAHKQGDIYKSLYNYQAADEWAAQAGYVIPHLNYSYIPYNIASMMYRDGRPKEMLPYLKTALQYAEHEDFDDAHIWINELTGIAYRNLNIYDSAWLYYDKALITAEKNDRKNDKNRIFFNKCNLLSDNEDYDFAERKSLSLLSEVNDSDEYCTHLLYNTLARIYNNTNKPELAYKYIYMAKAFEDFSYTVKTDLYTTLIDIEQKRGNAAKVAEYKKELEGFAKQKATNRTIQEEKLYAELGKKVADLFRIKHEERTFAQEQIKHNQIIALFSALLFIAVLYIAFAWYKSRGKLISVINQIPSEAILASLNGVTKNKREDDFLVKFNEIIDQNVPNSEFNVDHIAKTLNMSRAVMYTKIRNMSDLTPNEFIKVKRLRKAAEYLAEGGYRINEICYMVGFNSPSYFSKCFHKQFGVLPKEFCSSSDENDTQN